MEIFRNSNKIETGKKNNLFLSISAITIALFLSISVMPNTAHAFASLVQVKHVYPGQTATFDNPVKAGNLIVVFASGNQGSSSIATCNDSLGNSYTKVGSFMTSDGLTTRATAFYSWNVLGGTNTVSTTLTAATDIGITILEYAGIRNDIDPLDTYATSANSAADPIVAPLTTTAKDLIVYYWANESLNRYVAPNTGFTQVSYDSGHFDATGQLLTAERNTTHSPGIDVSSYADHSMLVALAFKVKRETLAKPPNNLGLVGYWSMEDATGTQATDFSGYNGTATISGNPTWENGKRGKALNFDGSGDYTSSTYTGPTMSTSSDFTISFWANPTNVTADQYAINARRVEGDAGNNPAVILGYQDGYWNIYNSGYPGGSASNGQMAATAGVWQHVTYTSNGSNLIGYVNGTQIINYVGSFRAINNITGFIVGAVGTIAGGEYTGLIDDVRVYNRALTGTEVAALYGSGLRKVNSTAAGRGPTSGLVGHWTFDGQHLNTTTSTDVSGQANHGTLVSTPVPTIGKLGQALNFSGSNYVEVPHNSTLEPADITVCQWINPSTFASPGGAQIFYKGGNSGYRARVQETTGIIRFFDRGGTNPLSSNTAVALNAWTHMCITGDSDIRIYLNGVLDIAGGSAYGGPTPGGSFYIAYDGGIGDSLFTGSIDDVRVYNRALSASEILQLYRMGVSN